MRKIGFVFASGFLAGAASIASGQTPRPPFGGPGVRILGAQPGRPGQVVRGSPYSAEVTTEITQVLPDGNRIHQVTSERVYHDSEGRTRREPSLSGVGLATPGASGTQLAFIDDPVAGASYALDLGSHTVTKMAWREPPSGRGRSRQTVPRSADPNRKTESLGRQTIAGLIAEGTRITQTIPTGQIGNTLPIQIVTERWYSPDLQTVILQKRSDPRTGESVSQWTNISRAEPPANLFVVPQDYAVTQDRPPRRRGPNQRAEPPQ
ncbi:MAG: hypothetical protein JOZ22_09665 [Acidobacteriia bacterium]|nr:hypothetical protein [Terriglobia bacterium]